MVTCIVFAASQHAFRNSPAARVILETRPIFANPSGMNTYRKSARKPSRMNTCKIIGLKVALLTSWAQFGFCKIDRRGETVFSGRAGGDDGRDWTPALGSRGLGSGHPGFACLPHSIQQTSVHPAAVAGRALSDALRGLDLSRSRGTSARASRAARSLAVEKRAGLHHAVSLPAAARR